MKKLLCLVSLTLFLYYCGSGKEECLNENLIANQCRKSVLLLRSPDESCTAGNLCDDSLQKQNLFLVSCLALDAQRKKCEGRINISVKQWNLNSPNDGEAPR